MGLGKSTRLVDVSRYSYIGVNGPIWEAYCLNDAAKLNTPTACHRLIARPGKLFRYGI